MHEEKNLIASLLVGDKIKGVTVGVVLFPNIDYFEMSSRKVIYNVVTLVVNVAGIDDLIVWKEDTCGLLI